MKSSIIAALLTTIAFPLSAQTAAEVAAATADTDAQNASAVATHAQLATAAAINTTTTANDQVRVIVARAGGDDSDVANASQVIAAIMRDVQAANAAALATVAATTDTAAATSDSAATSEAAAATRSHIYSSDDATHIFSRPTMVYKCPTAWIVSPGAPPIGSGENQAQHQLAPEDAEFWIVGESNGVTRIRFLQWESGWQRIQLNGDELSPPTEGRSEMMTNPYTWCVGSAIVDEHAEEIFPHRLGVSAGALSIPFKIRVDQDRVLDANAGLSASFGLFWEPRNPNIRLTVLTALGVAGVSFTDTDGASASSAALSVAVGVSAEFYNIGVGFLVGWDWLLENGSRWASNGEPWIGISLGAGFLSGTITGGGSTQ